MDVFDGVRLGEDQKIVIALLVAGASDEAITAKMIFVKTEPLDLRTHGAVENEDAFACSFAQRLEDFRAVALCPHRAKKIV